MEAQQEGKATNMSKSEKKNWKALAETLRQIADRIETGEYDEGHMTDVCDFQSYTKLGSSGLFHHPVEQRIVLCLRRRNPTPLPSDAIEPGCVQQSVIELPAWVSPLVVSSVEQERRSPLN